jgi:hypothetical protein
LNNKLASGLGQVVGALKQYTPELDCFRQLLRTGSLDQLQARGERLQQSFNAMLQGYDLSMTAVVEMALSWLDDYDRSLRKAGGF